MFILVKNVLHDAEFSVSLDRYRAIIYYLNIEKPVYRKLIDKSDELNAEEEIAEDVATYQRASDEIGSNI